VETFGRTLDLSQLARGGEGPHEVYAYTFPSLVALAESRGVDHYPVKIGYTAAASEIAPSLFRIDSQLGDSSGRFEPATVLAVWNSWNGRKLGARIHSHLRSLKRRLESAIGREWYNTNVYELRDLLEAVRMGDVSRLPLTPKWSCPGLLSGLRGAKSYIRGEHPRLMHEVNRTGMMVRDRRPDRGRNPHR